MHTFSLKGSKYSLLFQTIGVAYASRKVEYESKRFSLQIWVGTEKLQIWLINI